MANDKRVINNEITKEVERLCEKYIEGWAPYEYPSLASLEGYDPKEEVKPAVEVPTFDFG